MDQAGKHKNLKEMEKNIAAALTDIYPYTSILDASQNLRAIYLRRQCLTSINPYLSRSCYIPRMSREERL